MQDGEDAKKSLSKLPKSHQQLANGFEIVFEPANTLQGDEAHVGVIMTSPKRQIRVASPWRYGREFAFLHEIGHLVWAKYVKGTDLEKEWSRVVKLNPHRKKEEPDEENHSHAYANTYIKNKMVIHTHPAWDKFIRSLPK